MTVCSGGVTQVLKDGRPGLGVNRLKHEGEARLSIASLCVFFGGALPVSVVCVCGTSGPQSGFQNLEF